MQVCCRDRNHLALQADLLAAAAAGIENSMAVTGDPPQIGEHPEAKAVDDLDLDALLEVIGGMQQGRDMAEVEPMRAPRFLLGMDLEPALSQNSDTEAHISRRNDLEVGFYVAAPLFDIEVAQRLAEIRGLDKVTVIPKILLLKSAGMARHIERNLPQMGMNKDILARIDKAGDKVRECRNISTELVRTVKNAGFGGVMIAPMGWEDRLPEILSGL
jgi:5,10-methylenetetrahydrofolate reductase